MPTDHDELACDMTAIDAAERKEHEEVSRRLLESVSAIRERPDGYALELPGDRKTLRDTALFISRERQCCPFLDFTLEVGAAEVPIRLTLSGGDGVKAYLGRTLVSAVDGGRSP